MGIWALNDDRRPMHVFLPLFETLDDAGLSKRDAAISPKPVINKVRTVRDCTPSSDAAGRRSASVLLEISY